jgi:outer membrane protein
MLERMVRRRHAALSVHLVRAFLGFTSIAVLAGGALPGAAYGETLKEALTAAYLYNPTLKSARAALRATDNGVAQAKSGYRPTITGTFQGGFADTRTQLPGGARTPSSSTANGTYYPGGAQIQLQQNVFDGFRTHNAIKGAEASVEAGRESLRQNETNVLLTAITAYMNVVRDQAIVNLRQNNIKVLSEQLRATQDKQKQGLANRTEVTQAEATLASARADLSIAQGTLYGDIGLFVQFIGHNPGVLKDSGPAIKLLPRTLEQAIAMGNARSPLILQAIFQERAQAHVVEQMKGQLLPSATLNAGYSKNYSTNQSIDQIDDTRIGGSVSVPVYQAGRVSAQIRQAIETQSQLRQQIDVQRAQTRANVVTAWAQLTAAKGNIAAGLQQIEATQIALDGVVSQEKVGQTTILDVLSAEQSNLLAQVNVVSFRRDLAVASYSILASIGRLSASEISLQAEIYDPSVYYNEVKDKWYGWEPSAEGDKDPRVPAVRDPGLAPGQKPADGPAYTQKLPPVP